MKRYGMIIIALTGMVFVIMTAMAFALQIQGSKHDLSYNTGQVNAYHAVSAASGGTSEICVFCHTPHGGNADAPLWNRSTTQTGYIPYVSDVMSLLSITAENPSTGSASAIHIKKTRICLTCHDGTVALGKLVRMPRESSGAEIVMTPNAKMQNTSAGYIGLDLRDDHPVAVQYDSGKDTELNSSISTKVRLYTLDASSRVIETKSSGGYVECTSCHKPHDNEFGNFLVDSNHNSKICTSCHNKSGFTGSVHDDSNISVIYSPPDGVGGYLGETSMGKVGDVKCMSCHFPHRSGITAYGSNENPSSGAYLLTYQESKSCYNATNRWGETTGACHGSDVLSKRGIELLVNGTKPFRHPIGAWTDKHQATEARGASPWLLGGNVKWHIECSDCHNPHTAGPTTHTAGAMPSTISSSSPLYGVQGVIVSSYPTWPNGTGLYSIPSSIHAAGVTNNTLTGAQNEYEICLKCHSDFAWGTAGPPTVAYNNISTPSLPIPLTNQAMEFGNNGGSASSHPVIFTNLNNKGTFAVSSPWSAMGGQLMYCSDCHTNDSVQPAGPHGSANRALLVRQFDPSTIGQNTASDLCYYCHDSNTYYGNPTATGTGFRSGTNNLHYKHMNPAGVTYQPTISKACTRCHTNPIHGSNKRHLISYMPPGDIEPYGTYSYITNYTPNDTDSYTAANCSVSTCHFNLSH